MTSLADDTRWLDATDQAALVRNGEVSARELLDAAIERYEMHGRDGVTPASAYCSARITTVGLKFSW
jgi:Asp-tRNA(Asn)/Glu-tRNA(Gln) amidotransferase A subunit family amidase